MKKRICICVLAVCVLALSFSGCALQKTSEATAKSEGDAVNILVLGTDDAAGNTDVMMLVRCDMCNASLSVMQIPRDTYLKNDLTAPKVNHIYPALLAAKKSEKQALAETAAILADAFSVPIDFALALRPAALARLVDEIGGVPITLPTELIYDDPQGESSIRLPAGEQVLDGDAAVQFVRHRAGYLEGDLGRIDAQKIFLCAFMEKAKNTLDLSHLLSLLVRPPQGITLLGDKLRLASVAKEFYQNKSNLRALYFSLPGEAVRPEGNGAWYYVLNRKASASLLVQYFGLSGEGAFDRATRFCGPTLNFENIYFATGYPYRVFTADEIQNITIKKKE